MCDGTVLFSAGAAGPIAVSLHESVYKTHASFIANNIMNIFPGGDFYIIFAKLRQGGCTAPETTESWWSQECDS